MARAKENSSSCVFHAERARCTYEMPRRSTPPTNQRAHEEAHRALPDWSRMWVNPRVAIEYVFQSNSKVRLTASSEPVGAVLRATRSGTYSKTPSPAATVFNQKVRAS